MPALIFLLSIFTIYIFVKIIISIVDNNTNIGKFLLKSLGYTILWVSFFAGFFAGILFWLVWLLGCGLGGFLVKVANDMKPQEKATDNIKISPLAKGGDLDKFYLNLYKKQQYKKRHS
jgi:hypothetical protein